MHQGPVQGEAEIADLTGSLGGTSLRSSVPPRRQRGNGAFHQAELPLSCSLEGTKVAGLEAVSFQLDTSPGHLECVFVELAAHMGD